MFVNQHLLFSRSVCVVALFSLATIALGAPASGAWDPDGLPVCTAANSQLGLVSCPDEMGGMIMVWQDNRDGNLKIYAQRVDGAGHLLWTTDGVPASSMSQGYHPWVCPDGAGGAYVAWNYRGGDQGSIFVQHLDADGSLLWGSVGESIANGSIWSDNWLPVCTVDGAGGVVIAWVNEIDPPSADYQVAAQRLTADATRLWTSQGRLVGSDIGAGEEISIAADEDVHGVFLGWVDSGGLGRLQRVDGGGNPCWVSTSGYSLGAVVDGSRVRVAERERASGGCFVLFKWHHSGTGIFDFDALRVSARDSSTTEMWYEDLDSGGGLSGYPEVGDDYRVTTGGDGGCGCVWDKIDDGAGDGVFAALLEYNGDYRGEGVLQVSSGTDGNHLPDATLWPGYNGICISWVDDSGAEPALKYATVEYSLGVVMGRSTVPGGNSGTRPCIVTDPATGSDPLISWMDERPGGGYTDIYAAGMQASGVPTAPYLRALSLTPGTPTGLAGGEPHSFFVSVWNFGGCASDSFWVGVYPNQATAPEVGDPLPSGVHPVRCGPLASHDTVVAEVLVDAPGSAQTWTMWGFADYPDEIEEFSFEDDNVVGPVTYEWLAYPNLEITSVVLSDATPDPWQFVTATVTVKNTGTAAASPVWIDYWMNEATAPSEGETGDERRSYFYIGPGDSVVWTTSPRTSETFCRWTSWFRVDTPDLIGESDETDNLSGPHYFSWRIPVEGGWPRDAGGGFHSSPAIAYLDNDPLNLEVVIGCDDGKVYAWGSDGEAVAGWPVTLPDTVNSSPAVGDITGDSHNEVVVGCTDGKLYAYDFTGAKLWEYPAGAPVTTTPALADLDGDDKLEIVFSAGGNLYVLEGSGAIYSASWPYAAAAGGTFTSPAVGNVNGAGDLEIAVIAHGYTKPAVCSYVYLLTPKGTPYSAAWPVTVDTVVVADPVIGDVVTPTTDLEIVSGGINGKVYLWKPTGVAWTAPRTTGIIETSPALADIDTGDEFLEIIVTSRKYVTSLPPTWDGYVTAIDGDGSIMTGWPKNPGDWILNTSSVPSAVIVGTICKVMLGLPDADVYAMTNLSRSPYGFPIDAGGPVASSAAIGDLDGDDWLELVVAGGDSVRCWELCADDFAVDDLWWPMFRHDRARTGCYGFVVPTDVAEEEAVPAANAIRSIYPNPFNPTARVAFDVREKCRVEIAVFDVAGRKVAVLVDGIFEAGRHEAIWTGITSSGRTAASGVYFFVLRAGEAAETRKAVLIR